MTTAVLTRDIVRRNKYFETQAMTPSEYCEKWIPLIAGLYPDERGYKTACIKELQRVTGLSEDAIKKWGADMSRHPENVKHVLNMANTLNTIKQALGFAPDTQP